MKTFSIKNMVCNRCLMAVEQVAEKLRLPVEKVTMGELVLKSEPSNSEIVSLSNNLKQLGFEILDNQKQQTIGKIKNIIIEYIHYSPPDKTHNLSDILAEKLNKDYSHLSGLFSEVEGTTIEKYAIAQKIEKAKELITYDELSLSQIAVKLGYSSVAHLSSQFKKVTGLTPSHFKRVGLNKRKPLDHV